MKNFDLLNLTTEELLESHSLIMDELINRKVIRTRNKPTGDYAEWLVSKKLNLRLSDNSHKGYDAIGKDQTRFQIKSRQLSRKNASRQLSVIRNLKELEFDYLIAVFFNKDYSVESAVMLPHEIIEQYARFSPHQNGHILILKGDILEDKQVIDITKKLL